jgi:adenylate cyclase
MHGFSRMNEPFDLGVLIERVLSANAMVVLVYLSVVSILLSFIRQVDRKFGPGNLVRLLIGRYHRPREEQRIFQFLDLQASTTHAERLGHMRYSRLLQDCFRDLAVIVQDHAEVYQYVGDEAVLCWKAEVGLEGAACLAAYFRFSDELKARAAHYEENYGFVPLFKAGLNIGRVTVAEVGEIKREIAFHGDVLNTAARIQAMCNELGEQVLVSAYLKDALGDTPDYLFTPRGDVTLRGRAESVEIFGVRRATDARQSSSISTR